MYSNRQDYSGHQLGGGYSCSLVLVLLNRWCFLEIRADTGPGSWIRMSLGLESKAGMSSLGVARTQVAFKAMGLAETS